LTIRSFFSERKKEKITKTLKEKEILTKFQIYSDHKNEMHKKDPYFKRKIMNMK